MKQTARLTRRPLRQSLEPSLRRTGFRSASAAQRAKVVGRRCIACGAGGPVDPAHVVPRSKGGCDHPDCAIPLCRPCHRRFDDGALDLSGALNRLAGEVQHALTHMSAGLLERRLRCPLPRGT